VNARLTSRDRRRSDAIPEMREAAIRSFQPVKELIDSYLASPHMKKPISVAVFGPPGSGRAYFTEQFIEARFLVSTVFRLALHQMKAPSDLTEALDLIAGTMVETGIEPFIFVEDFDGPLEGRDGGWLPHFLAMMMGQFWNGSEWRQIGRAVFMFLGTSPTLSAFVGRLDQRDSKRSDFAARLSAHVNLAFPDSAERFRHVCEIITPDFDDINKEMFEYFAANPDALQGLEWRKFEELLDAVFRNQGYKTVLGPGRADGGIDIRLVSKDSIGCITTLVQAKRYAKRPIELQAVQALSAAVEDERANRGLFVTTSRYLPVARTFAARQNTKLHLATSVDVARWCEQASRSWPNTS
jgi:hypothetical protein